MSIRAKAGKGQVRRRLMASGAMASAIVALMLSPDARAQAVNPNFAAQGTPVVNSGGVAITRAPTVDTVRVTTTEAVVTWTPFDTTGTGTINFLPDGTQIAFIGDSNFTILNRILPVDATGLPMARMIALNGLVTSAISGGQQQGGSVWFYSPGGILVGGTSVINVGSLVLTTRDIDTTGGLFGSNGEIRFRDPAIAANGSIEIDARARISAATLDPGGAYIAMVAPRIVQAGSVNADGSVALVAAEQADIRINQGLFDINVLVGSGDAHGIEHSGTTGGASDISPTNENRVFMVAIPKNQAMTMLLSGNVGHQTPTSATVNANGGIVLSAGRNIVNGAVAGNAPGTGAANISITDTIFRNDLVASATGSINGRPNASCAPFFCSATSPSGQIRFNGNARFAADRSVSLSVGQAQQIIAVGDLELTSGRPGVGGSVSLTIDNAAPPTNSTTGGGFISVGNNLLLDASARGDTAVADGAATGGTATLSVASGLLRAANVDVLANATGSLTAQGLGAAATGGNASVIGTGGVIETPVLRIQANAVGGGEGVDAQQNPTLAPVGGNATGGNATLNIFTGRVTTSSFVSVTADGTGGTGSVTSGDGRGGTARALVNLADFAVPTLLVRANGFGGGSGFSQFSQNFIETTNGGDGYGGTAQFEVANSFSQLSQLTVNNVSVDASGRGGDASLVSGSQPPAGGDGFGGSATTSVNNATETIGFLSTSANATGGDARGANAVGGNAVAGFARLLVNGSLTGQFVSVFANARGGGAPVAGNGTGGTITLDSNGNLTTSSVVLSADGIGGGDGFAQSSAPTPVIGGDGTGGTIQVTHFGQLTVGQLEASASGRGSNGVAATGGPTPSGGDGLGGGINFDIFGSNFSPASLVARADGIGGAASNSPNGQDGNASGGSIGFNASAFGATVTIENDLILSAQGIGTAGSGTGGDLRGGNITVQVFGTGTTVTVNGSSNFDASARASRAVAPLATGGQAFGGNVFLRTGNDGTFRSNLVDFNAGASSFSVSGTAGDVFAGQVLVEAFSEGTIEVTGTGISRMNAIAEAGSGATGGRSTGGYVQLSALGGRLALAGITAIDVSGYSGGSSVAAQPAGARGGVVGIRSDASETSVLDFASLGISANAGYSSTTILRSSNGEEDLLGDAFGGNVAIEINGGTVTGGSMSINADAQAIGAGYGQGGLVSFTQTGGDATIGNVFATATGQGGTSLPGQFGGFGEGGQFIVRFTGGTYTGNSFNLNSTGFGGSGIGYFANGEGDSFAPGDGGQSMGGIIDVGFDGDATVNVGSMQFRSFGQGGDGGSYGAGDSGEYFEPGAGGTGIGGEVRVNLLSGTVNAEIIAAANGEGGAGGRLFVDSETSEPTLIGTPDFFAARGGDGVGGFATITLAGAIGSPELTVDTSAVGGRGGRTLAGGEGGRGSGGVSRLIIDDLDASQPQVRLVSRGLGGDAGDGLHGAGGRGGDGNGGELAVIIRGANGSATIDGASFDNQGRGGDGGDGRLNDDFAPVERGFDGGNGGHGTGGSISLTATDGDLLLTDSNGEGFGVTISTSGFGGNGGNGADNNSGNPLVPTFGGNAGFGGGGYGGSITLTAEGGTIRTDDGVPLFLEAIGEGSNFLATGGAGNVTSTTDPMTGITTFFGGDGFSTFGSFSVGGAITLAALNGENGPGLIDLDSVSINVSGSLAGRVALLDDATGAGIALGSLSIDNSGFPIVNPGFPQSSSGVYIRSRDGAITIDNGLSLNIFGDFRVDASGTGGLDVNGSLDVTASNDFTATHEGREGDGRTIEADSITIQADRIDFRTGSNVVATAGSMTLSANSEIVFDQIRSDSGNVDLTSGGRIFGNTASAAGDLTADSGSSTVIGGANAGNNVIVDAGANIQIFSLTTASGFAQLTGNGVDVSSGDIATTFTVRSGSNVILGRAADSESPALGVQSGGLSDIEAVGDIAIVALTTTGAGVNSSSPAAAIRLSAGGTVSTGALSSADNISISAAALALASGPNAPASVLTADGGIFIDTTGDAVFGTASAQTIFVDAGGSIAYTSTDSDDDTELLAGGSITGQSTTTIDGDARLRGGGTVSLANASIGDALTLTSTGGNVVLGTSVSGYDTRIDSAGTVRVTSARTTDIGGSAAITTANIIINAVGDVALGVLDAAENITITAGSISGATSSLTAALQAGLTTTGGITFGTLNAQTLLANAGGALSFGQSQTSGFTSMTAGTGITGGSARSTGSSVSIQSTTGNIAIDSVFASFGASVFANGGNIALGNIEAGFGGIGIGASGSVGVTSATSGAGIGITSGGNATIGTTTSVGSTVVDAGGTITATRMTTTGQDNSQSGSSTNGAIRLFADGDVVIGALDALGQVQIDARNVSGPLQGSSIRAGESITIDATQAVQFGTANGASLDIDAGGNVTFDASTTSGLTDIDSGGAITGQTITTTGGDALLDAIAGVDIGTATIGNELVVKAGTTIAIGGSTSVRRTSLTAGGNVDIGTAATTGTGAFNANIEVNAGGRVDANALTSSQSIVIGAGSIDIDNLTAASAIGLTSDGDTIFGILNGGTANIDVGGDLLFGTSNTNGNTTVFAEGDISGGSLTSDFGNLSVASGEGAITLAIAQSGRNTTITAPGIIAVQSAIVGDRLEITGGSNINLGSTSSGDDTIVTSGGTIRALNMQTTSDSSQSSASANGSIRLFATADVMIGALDSSDGVIIEAARVLQNAGGGGSSATSSITAVNDVVVTTLGDASIGSVDAARFDLTSGGTVDLGSSETSSWTRIRANGDIAAGTLTSIAASLTIQSATGSLDIGSARSDGSSIFGAAGSVDLGSVTTRFGNVDISAGQDAIIGSASIGGSLFVFAGDDASIAAATAGGFIIVNAGDEIAAGRLTTTGNFVSGTEDFPPVDTGGEGGGNTGGGGEEGGGGEGGGEGSGEPISFASILLSSNGATTVDTLDSAGGIMIGAATLAGTGSTIEAVNDIAITTVGNAVFGTLDGGEDATITTGGTLGFASTSTDQATVITAAGSVTGAAMAAGDTVDVTSSSGGIAIGEIVADGDIALTANNGLVSGNFAESVFGSIEIRAGSVDFGELFADNVIDIAATGAVALDFGQTGGEGGCGFFGCGEGSGPIDQGNTALTPTGNDILIEAGGSISLGELNAEDNIVLVGASLTGSSSELLAGDRITITTTGDALFGSMTAEDGIALTAGGIANGQSAVTTATGSALALSATNGLTLASINAGGTATLTASAGAVAVANLRSTGLVNAAGRSIAITGNGALDFATLNATQGDASVRMASGNLVVRDGRATGALTLTGDAGSIETRGLQAGTIALTSSQSVTMNGNTTATGALGVTSRGFTTVGGVATGATVRITSGNIAIGANGRVGTAGTTTSVLLINGDGSARTFVGGDDTTGGYSLSAAEMLRLFANDITIRAPRASIQSGAVSGIDAALIGSSRAPDVIIGAFTLNGGAAAGGNLGSTGTLRIETPGSARVTGSAVLNGVATGNGFVLAADESIEVILGSGSIRLNGANGLAGRLTLDSQDVVVATADAIADIAGLTDMASIDDRLAQNDGIVSDDGAIAAGTIAITADNGVFIQNSGTGDSLSDRRGFTTGVGGLAITLGGSTSATGTTGSGRIVINGRIASDTGGFLTGLDTFDRVTVNGVTLGRTNTLIPGIDIGSTINGCEIFNTVLCSFIPSGPPIQDNPLVDRDDVESEASDETVLLPGLITLKDLAPLPNEPLVDDPVTGSGNDDLWSPDANEDEDEEEEEGATG